MASRHRISKTDSVLYAYLNVSTKHLQAPFREEENITITPGSTHSIEMGEFVPPYLSITLQNTGTASDADLQFCMAAESGTACTPGSGVLLLPGSSQTVKMKDLGLKTGFIFFNITNADPAKSGNARIVFEPNWKRLGMAEEQFLQWKNYAKNWTNKYLLSQNALTRTKAIVAEKNLLRKEYTALAGPILQAISGHANLCPTDRLALNLHQRDRVATPRPAITQVVNTTIKIEPGCNLKFTHRVDSDANRSSILPISNGVEIRWILLDLSAPPPTQPEQCHHSSISTRAIHTLSFGMENAHKKFYAFCRWINTSEPAKNGPWSTLLAATVVG